MWCAPGTALCRHAARLAIAVVCAAMLFVSAVPATSAQDRIEAGAPIAIYLFWQEGCPYCAGARAALEAAFGDDPQVLLVPREIGRERQTDQLFADALSHFRFDQAGVPLVVIGERALMGFYEGGESVAAYRELVERCRAQGCVDTLALLAGAPGAGTQGAGSASAPGDDGAGAGAPAIRRVIDVPFFGPVDIATLSLPAVTVLLAAVDGFNPCAMWVLVFLIGLLLGLEQRSRRWLLGGVFLAATGIMYFAVIAAWFNVVAIIGAAGWLRIAVGVLALWAGFWFLREYWTKPDAVCRVTDARRRARVMDAFRAAVGRNRLILACIGIAALAAAVNLIELVCSAGVPAVFAQILSLNSPSPAASYGYIALYVLVFMLDDIAIFATAMIALEVSGLAGRYARYSHLIGGIVLLAIGALLLLRPDLLAFG